MDDAYYRYPAGSSEHYEAYKKEFIEQGGAGYPFPDDAWSSYEVENAYELAWERFAESGGPDNPDMDEDAEREDDYGCTFRPRDLDVDPEPGLMRALEQGRQGESGSGERPPPPAYRSRPGGSDGSGSGSGETATSLPCSYLRNTMRSGPLTRTTTWADPVKLRSRASSIASRSEDRS